MSDESLVPWRVTSGSRRDFRLLRSVLLVFADDALFAQIERRFEESCSEVPLVRATGVGQAVDLLAAAPFTVVVGTLALPDGPLTEVMQRSAALPFLVLVDEGQETRGLAAVAAGALDWAACTPATLAALPDISLGLAREWRESGRRRAAEEQLRHADRLALIGRVAAGVLHEIGTPLNVVRMRAQLMGLDPIARPDGVPVIVEQCDRITELVQQTLAMARHPDGERGPVNLRDVAVHAAALVGPTLKKQQLSVVVHGESLVVTAEEPEIMQVVMNLLTNAADAMAGQRGTVEVYVSQHGSLARLAVVDSGAGVAPEHLDHIFAPFFTTKGPGKGTGLGLSVSAQIAADHGGRITAHSDSGHGATFTLELPVGAPPDSGGIAASAADRSDNAS